MNIETNRLLLIPINEKYTREIFEYFNDKIITYMLPTVAKNINWSMLNKFDAYRAPIIK